MTSNFVYLLFNLFLRHMVRDFSTWTSDVIKYFDDVSTFQNFDPDTYIWLYFLKNSKLKAYISNFWCDLHGSIKKS